MAHCGKPLLGAALKRRLKQREMLGLNLPRSLKVVPKRIILISESAGNIMGHANARSGAARLASLCQNSHLNTHFAYTVLDELIAILFPELGHPREHSLDI
jgi:hypothetical protein